MPSKPSAESSEPQPSLQQIVEKYLPDVQWVTPVKGLCLCPGREKHTSKSTKKDCAVFLDGKVPTVYCFHQNCQEEIQEVNEDIRDAWRYFQPEISPEERQKLLVESARRHELEARALAAKPQILKNWKWDIFSEALDASLPEQFQRWKQLWTPEDYIWIGEPHSSGQFFHKSHFGMAEDMVLRGHFGCASIFKSGTFSRTNENVATTPFLVVEGDAVLGVAPKTESDKHDNKLACAAIFNWLRKEMGLKLRAVISSGNKSLHGWFNMPDKDMFNQLRVILPALGCDRALFKPSQPVRIPGILRENGNPQQLLYIS